MKKERHLTMILRDLNYDIHISNGDFLPLYERLREYARIFVVTDQTVYDYYGDVFHDLKKAFDTVIHIIHPGETSKSIETYEMICTDFLNQHIKRDDVILAFGGGVVGDLTGFVAATLLRGIDLIQIPTTLLSMVDSSIGSKVGINTKQGKNLIGQFYEPTFVFIQLQFLKTLSKRELNNGYAEMIKAGLIGDPSLFELLKQHDHDLMTVIYKALKVKMDLVKKDPFENNERMYLNFGHTLGHAIEKHMGYEGIKHGEAISHGMMYAIEKGIEKNITPLPIKEVVLQVLHQYQLLEIHIEDVNVYEHHIFLDKKQRKDGLRFVCIKDIGIPVIVTL